MAIFAICIYGGYFGAAAKHCNSWPRRGYWVRIAKTAEVYEVVASEAFSPFFFDLFSTARTAPRARPKYACRLRLAPRPYFSQLQTLSLTLHKSLSRALAVPPPWSEKMAREVIDRRYDAPARAAAGAAAGAGAVTAADRARLRWLNRPCFRHARRTRP